MAKLLAVFGITKQQDITPVASKNSEDPELSEMNKTHGLTSDTSKPSSTTPDRIEDDGGGHNAVAEESGDTTVFQAPAQTSDGQQQTESRKMEYGENLQEGASKALIRGTGEDLEEQHDPTCLRGVLSLALNG